MHTSTFSRNHLQHHYPSLARSRRSSSGLVDNINIKSITIAFLKAKLSTPISLKNYKPIINHISFMKVVTYSNFSSKVLSKIFRKPSQNLASNFKAAIEYSQSPKTHIIIFQPDSDRFFLHNF